jgi:hypothetical protein
MKVGNAFKIASLCSFVILLSLYVAYSVGAFDSLLGRNESTSSNTTKTEPSHTHNEFISSSKKAEVFKPPSHDDLALQEEDEPTEIKLDSSPTRFLHFSSKSGVVIDKIPPKKDNTKNQEKQIMGGSKTKQVFKPPLQNELKPKAENEKTNKNKNEAEDLDLELMDGTKSAPVFKKDK